MTAAVAEVSWGLPVHPCIQVSSHGAGAEDTAVN
jgi:hypothetical protein